MSKFKVSAAKEAELLARMAELDIQEADLDEKFIKGSGAGGQKINKTSSCVYLIHKPSGIEVKCQQTRSQSLNRFYARRELCEKLAEQMEGIKSAKQQAIEKIKRQKRKRSKRAKEKMLADKKERSKLKQNRRNVTE